MPRERILITVKTYPTLSKKYGEIVCTAGIREDGTWVRIFPVPFRRLEEVERYRKYDWIECHLTRNTKDHRPESFRPTDSSGFQTLRHIGTDHQWQDRRKLLLRPGMVQTSMRKLIDGAKANQFSLAVFKPTKVTGFRVEEEDAREWGSDKLQQMREYVQQLNLFEDNEWRKTFKVIPKLAYKFSYTFTDIEGKSSTLQIFDWEIGALLRNTLQICNGNEPEALDKVRHKYWSEFMTTDLHFFLGTTHLFHNWAPNPWVIIGVFPIPHEIQPTLNFS